MELVRLQIIHLLETSGLNLEQMLFVVRDVYKDVDHSFNEELKRQAEESRRELENAEDIQSN